METVAAPRVGNLQRAEWRQKCRQVLSDHLNSQLGLVVEPAQVRLKPHVEDKYEWAALPEKKHLFNKHLSKHSVGALMELCREVGETFEAVAYPLSALKTSNEATQDPGLVGCATFTSTIRQLREENDVLVADLSRLKQETEANSVARLYAENQAEQLQLDLHIAQLRVEILEEENKNSSSKVRQLTRRVTRFKRDAKKASLILHRITPDTTLNGE